MSPTSSPIASFDRQWMENLNQVRKFYEQHGRYPKFTDSDPVQTAQAQWLANQRRVQAAGKLHPARLRMLDEAAPGWRNPRDPAWLERVDELRRFHEKHGRMPSLNSNHGAEVALYYWLRGQRRKNASGDLPGNRLALLDQHLPGWAVTRGLRTAAGLPEWMKNFQLVLDYRNEHGCLPTAARGISPERRVLVSWLQNQRAKARNGRLLPERKQLLDDAFPGWAMPREERDAIKWNQQLADVAAFKAKHGVIPRDDKLEANEHALRGWLARQRQLHAEGKLPADQLEALNAVDADWLANGTSLIWENNFTAAVLHLGGTGSKENVEWAHRWLDAQRSNARRLSEDRLQALDDALPGWRRSHIESWQQRLQQVAADLADGRLLSPEDQKWLNGNRVRWLRGMISEEKIRMLDEAIPGWRTATAGRRSWDAALHRTAGNHAAGSLTREDARWLINQRIAHSRGKLAADKVSSLDANIPAWDVAKAGTWNWLASLHCAAANLAVGNLSAEDRDWLRVQRARRGTAYLPFERALALDLDIPSWRSADLLERENMERAAA